MMTEISKSLLHPDESVPLLQSRFGDTPIGIDQLISDNLSPNLRQCYDLLFKTGRSFGLTISVLNQEVRNAFCLFYLVLRAIDTVEDDMSIPSDVKVVMLKSFDKYLVDRAWKYSQSKDEYAIVLENFPIISQALHELPQQYRDIILDLGPQIGHGMAKFVGREIVTMEDFNEYSNSVAILFCIGFMRIFVASGLEDEALLHDIAGIYHFSLFVQKVNSIKDFRKDWINGRLYWPKDVWSKYASSPGDLTKPENRDKAVECVNEFITDALGHLPPVLCYLNKMRNSSSRMFCALNKVIGIASLERCYNNPEVFTQAVKISRGQMEKIFLCVSSVKEIMEEGRQYTLKIMERATQANSEATRTREACLKILDYEVL